MRSAASAEPVAQPPASAFYRAAWRWHFYAGLYVVPFILMLAVTGLIMVYGNSIETRFGATFDVTPGATTVSPIQQAKAAEALVPGGTVAMYIAPRGAEDTAIVMVDAEDVRHAVAVDPYSGQALGSFVTDDTWFNWASDIHGTFFLGDTGDRLIEIAAGFGIMLVITGLYLWWPRNGRGLASVLVPRLSQKGRAFWKELHVTTGFYIAIILLFFFISGMSWAGIWGERFVQAWSTFPAEKWDAVPLSDATHADLNHGPLHEVPWGLEQTPLPASGSEAGIAGVPEGTVVNLDSVVALARAIGFDEQFRVYLPEGAEGVYTLSADSMDGDTEDPTGDRTVHVDQFTGKILADVGYADYSLGAKAMAIGVALHQGDMGLWNTLLNTVYCLAVIFLTVSGVVMWWLRRPKGVLRLVPPAMPENLPLWRGAVFTILAVSLAFPLAGIALVAVLALDLLLLSRVPFLRLAFK